MKNSIRKIPLRLLYILFAFLYLNTIESQTSKTYTIETKLNLKDAISFKKADSYGIATQTNSGSSARATVSMTTTESVEFTFDTNLANGAIGSFSDKILIYKAFATGTNLNISQTASQLDYYVERFFKIVEPVTGRQSWYAVNGENTDSENYIKYMLRLAYAKISEKDQSTLNWFFFNADPTIDVEIQLTLENGMKLSDILKVQLPGLPTLYPKDFYKKEVDDLRDILENPNSYPNYIMLAAHRGYWMYAPENSLEAFKNAIDFGADMVEIDLKMTADNQVMVAHDFHLGRLTDLPIALQNPIFESNRDPGKYLFSLMKFCDLRPDLCPGGVGYDANNPNNCNTCTPTVGINNTAPVKLIRPNGAVAEKLPTLKEALDLFMSNKPVLIDMDKIDPGAGTPEQPKTYFFDAIYTIAKEKNILDRIIVKQRVDKFSAADLKASAVVDWKNWYFTPTVFSDYTDSNGTPLNDVLGSYFDDPLINCVGVEYIYMWDIDEVFPGTYNYIKGKNKRIFQFPAYPENAAGVWNPKPFLFSDIDPSDDRRNDWNWLLQKQRRPDVIISDRFEVLYDLLTTMGLRNKN